MKRFLAMLLTLCMLISMMSAFSVAPIVFAAGADGGITVAPLTSGSTYAGEAWYMNGKLSAFPRTIETEIKVSSEQAANNGVILGNYAYDSRQPYFIFRVLANGNLKVHYRDTANSNEIDFIFTNVNVISDKFVKVALVWDDLTGFVHCYVDGVLKQSIDKNTNTEITMQKMDNAICGIPFAVGSDRRTMGEGCFFMGEIRKVALYSDTRSATEIAADAAGTAVDANDENLLVAYNTTGDKQGKNIEDLSKNNIDLMYQKLQMSESEMTALCGTRGDYDYSIAIVGDMHTYQNAIDSLDWIAAKAKDRNIKYVLQTGDLTDKDTPAEWEKMLAGFKDLDGVVPYSVNIGNHDYYCGLGKYQINGGYNVNQYFGAHKPYTNLIDNYGGYFKKGDVANTYRTLDVNENIKYLFLNLEYTMSLDVVEWANKVIAEHPDHKVIITSHSYLYSNSNLTNNSIGHAPSRDNPDAVDGYQLWDMLVRKHKNIIMYVSGHELSDDVIMSQVKGDKGNTITQLLVNPQQVNSRMKAGVVSMLYFSNNGNDVRFESVNTATDTYFKQINQFNFKINADATYSNDIYQGESIVPEGKGTEADPYIIKEAGNIRWMSNQFPASLTGSTTHYELVFEDKYFKQVCDIDLNGYSFRSLGFYSNYNYVDETGTIQTAAFGGHYDGNGFKLKNGNFVPGAPSSDHDFSHVWSNGVFGAIHGATIENLTLDNIDVVSTGVTGGLVGVANAYAAGTVTNDFNKISNCHLTDTCDIYMRLPGRTTKDNAGAYGAFLAAGNVGTIVGSAIGTTIEYCSSDVDLVFPDYWYRVGGIAGIAGYNTVIDHCKFTGTITMATHTNSKNYTTNVGGIVGSCYPITSQVHSGFSSSKTYGTLQITNCYNSGDFIYASATRPGGWNLTVGGIIGFFGYYPGSDNRAVRPDSSTDLSTFNYIENCYNLNEFKPHNGLKVSQHTGYDYNLRFWNSGLVGKGLITDGSAAMSAIWIKNSASVDVQETGLDFNGPTTNGIPGNEYNNESKKSATGFYGVEPVLDAEGNSTVKTLSATEIKAKTDAIDSAIAAKQSAAPDYTIGKGAPTAAATAGDKYLDEITGNIYTYSTEWTVTGNIHAYDNACDTTCNTCTFTRTVTHDWKAAKDDVNHWQQCSVCSEKKDIVMHYFDDANDNSCNGCDFVGTLKFFSEKYSDPKGMIDAKKAVLLTNEEVLANAELGSAVALDWCGETFVFIKGENAFEKLGDIQAKNLDNPHILVKNNTEGKCFYLNFPAKAFTQNYAVSPVKVGTAQDGSDWKFNSTEWKADYEVYYDNFGVGLTYSGSTNSATAIPAGTYKLYGFTVQYHFLNYGTGSETDIAIENIRFLTKNWADATTTSSYNDGYSTDTKNHVFYFNNQDDADQDKVVIKNVYFSTVDSEKGLMGNLFDNAGLPEHLTYDTIFVDTTLSRAINGPNIVQLGDNTSFTIKNSLFRNYNILNAAFLGNGNNSVTEGVDRKVIIDNNIFYNSSFRSKKQNIISYHPKLLSEVQITNNNVIVPADSKYLSAGVYLAGVDDMQNVGTTPKPLKVVITGNYVDYAQGVVLFDGFAGKNTASDSVIENNYLRLKASATGLPIIYAGVPNVTSSNWLITADGTNHSGIIQPMTFDGDTFDKTETVTVTFVVDTINLLDHIGSPEAVTVSGSDYNGNVFEGYSDAELTTAVDLTAVPATESTTVYVKVSSPDGKTKTSDVYTINIVVDITHNWVYEYDDNNHWQKCIGGTCNCGVTTEVTPHDFDDDADTSCDCGYTRTVTLFSEAFVGDSYINKDKAVLLSNETALVNAKDGDGVKLSWRGTDYVFIKGTNAFTSLSAIQAKNLDNPHILVKNNTEGTNFYLNFPAKVFTQNYDVNPVKVGTANDGSDWAFNSTEWNSDYEVSYDFIGVGVNASNAAQTVAAGDYSFYGFTIAIAIRDYGANAATNVTLENTRFYLKDWGYKYSTKTGYIHSRTNESSDYYPLSFDMKTDTDKDSFTVKNAYFAVVEGKENLLGNIFPHRVANGTKNVMPEYTTLDCIYVGATALVSVQNGTITKINSSADTCLTVKNSCFRNYNITDNKIETEVAATSSQSVKLIFNDNIFYNTALSSNKKMIVSFEPETFTEVEFKNNNITVDNSTVSFIKDGYFMIGDSEGDFASKTPLKLTITGNHLSYTNTLTMVNNFKAKKSYTPRTMSSDSLIADNYVRLKDTAAGLPITFEGTPNVTSKTWLITADGSNTSSMIQPMTFNGEAFDTEETINVGSTVTTFNVAALLKNTATTTVSGVEYNGNTFKGYADEDCETPIDLANVAVAAAGTKIYVKVFSPDGLGSEIHTVVINKEKAFGITNTGLGAVLDTQITTGNYYWVTWRGEVSSTGVAVEGEADHRVGAIYLSDTTDLNAMKAEIERNIKAAGDVNAIETVVANANATIASKTIKAYHFHGSQTLSWNNESQSYGYRYNFNIKENYYRGVVMYVVFKDADGNIQIEFSDMVVQQAK